jgi:hypothetical protein
MPRANRHFLPGSIAYHSPLLLECTEPLFKVQRSRTDSRQFNRCASFNTFGGSKFKRSTTLPELLRFRNSGNMEIVQPLVFFLRPFTIRIAYGEKVCLADSTCAPPLSRMNL